MCHSMVDIQPAAAEIRRANKKEEEEKEERNRMKKIYIWSALLHRATTMNALSTTRSTVTHGGAHLP